MGKITVVLDDDLERRLRVSISQNGGKKGDLSRVISEAIELYLAQRQ